MAEKEFKLILEALDTLSHEELFNLQRLATAEMRNRGLNDWNKVMDSADSHDEVFEQLFPPILGSLTLKIYHTLRRNGVCTMKTLQALSRDELLSIRNLGKTKADYIEKVLREYNASLGIE